MLSIQFRFRASKRFVVQPVCTSTSRSRPATGKTLWRIASQRTRSVKWSLCWSLTNLCVKMDSWLAVTETVSSVDSSVTARKTVAMDQTRIRVVSPCLFIRLHLATCRTNQSISSSCALIDVKKWHSKWYKMVSWKPAPGRLCHKTQFKCKGWVTWIEYRNVRKAWA